MLVVCSLKLADWEIEQILLFAGLPFKVNELYY